MPLIITTPKLEEFSIVKDVYTKAKGNLTKLNGRKSKTMFSAIRAFSGIKMGTANYKEDQRYSDKKHNKPT